MRQPLFIGSEIYRNSSYGSRHPLAIPRVSTVIDLCRSLGWFEGGLYQDSPQASIDQLTRFHDADYLRALQSAERDGRASDELRERYGIGANGNPVFAEVFRRPATAAGASMMAARVLSETLAGASGPSIVFSPAGGTHHGLPARASGFCYLNDPVLAILTALDKGVAPIVYIDIDAHHGDGVQMALAEDPRVVTLSIHEEGRWPMGSGGLGGLDDRGKGRAVNIPVPAGFHDQEAFFLRDHVILPLLAEVRPALTVMQCGADSLADDPLSKLSLSNQAHRQILRSVKKASKALLVLGGGGYNPWSVARCWSSLWGEVSGQDLPDILPEPSQVILRGLTWRHRLGRNPPAHWFTHLLDREVDLPVRDGIKQMADQVMEERQWPSA